MIVANQSHLRSLIQEAGRQADFYRMKRDDDVANFWAELESLAFQARSSRRDLIVIPRESLNPPLIKACEQVQQLRKPLED